ncbi:MAG: PhnD/SsuA/transferrin family substrate-binding protein [Thiobacillus sp.]|nr:PhnD/SsuA/transferrin family substrate-binding protein [Thiobacillus sp.]
MVRVLLILWLTLQEGLVQAAMVIGVPPIHSMRTLAARYEPMRAYLESRLGEPVYLESALDFAEYQARTLRGEFDLTITPAHFGRLAQKDLGFHPLVQFQPDHDALLVYSADRPLDNLSLMQGQQLAVIDRLAVTVMASVHYLDEKGLEAGRDYRVVEYRNHASVGQALVTGLAMAGVTTSHGMKQIPEPVRVKLKVYAHMADIPAFVMLAKPGVSRADRERLQSAVLAFGQGIAGQGFLKGIAYSALIPANERMLKRVDGYLKETRKGLAP